MEKKTEYAWTLFETSMHFAYLGVRTESAARNPDAWQIAEVEGEVRIVHATSEPDGAGVEPHSYFHEGTIDGSAVAVAAVTGLRTCAHRDEFDSYGTPSELEIEIRLDLIRLAASPEVASAEACDAIEADHESLRHLAQERTLRIFVIVPDSAMTSAFETAISRRQQASLRTTLLAVLSENPPEDPEGKTRNLPSLIAVPLAMVERPHRTADSKWRAAAATAEAAIRYVAALAIARDLSGNRETRLQQIASLLETPTPPTLGRWVSVVRARPAAVRDLLPKTASVLWRKQGTTDVGKFFFQEYTADRNRYVHAGVMPEHECVTLLDKLWPQLQRLLEALAADAESAPLVVRSNLQFGEGEAFDYTLTELRGAMIILPSARAVTQQRLNADEVYLQRSATEFLAIDPLIVCQACDQCGVDEAFFLDKTAADRPSWLSMRGHTYPGRR